ncbi:hypothetical protein L7F22_022878 [Adiantum nelumboides]|nr:hypothetical protein [Adiantum nelumboides]
MVKGASCPVASIDVAESLFPLGIVLELEAASVYCQLKASLTLQLVQGDKIDLAVHQKADNDPDSMKFVKVVASYGDIGGGGGQGVVSTDSLARLLLSIATIQTQVAIILLDLIDAEKLTSKLMEVLSICPTPLQKEIISLIPEIASDDAHELVVCTLEQMLQGDSQLIAPILDAFSNLNLKEELLDQVVTLAIVSLRTYTRISKQTIEFESLFLWTLAIFLPSSKVWKAWKVMGSVGYAWMNLDGEVSPILLNIQSLLMSDDTSSSQALLFLPSSFRLLAAVERATNQGSLGNIDALLGCPLYLPVYKVFVGAEWQDLAPTLKETACTAIFHAINWIRELINTYSTQIQATNDNLTQATREEIAAKILKRMHNLIFFELLLGECMKAVPLLSFPILHSDIERGNGSIPRKNLSKGEPAAKKDMKRKAVDVEEGCTLLAMESSGAANFKKKVGQLEEQRWKYRSLSVHSLSILAIPQDRPSPGCCPDPYAELPLQLYILHDLHHKLECLDKQIRKTIFLGCLAVMQP